MRKIAVYGSLRSGFYNHKRFGFGDPIDTGTIRGAMYRCYTYPHLYREGVKSPELERDHVVEVYEIEDDLYDSILAMEIGAGYQEVVEEINDHKVTVFYSQDDLGYEFHWIDEYSGETVPEAVISNL